MRVYTPQHIDVFKDEFHLNEQSENDAHILPQFQKFLQSEESILKKAYVPYELYSLKLTISNILNDKNAKLMSESLDEERYTYPPEFTVSAIKDVYYTLTDDQIRLMKRMNDIVVILLVGNIGNNIELIVRDMDKCGYFVANRKDIRDSSDRLWSQIAFENTNDISQYTKPQIDYYIQENAGKVRFGYISYDTSPDAQAVRCVVYDLKNDQNHFLVHQENGSNSLLFIFENADEPEAKSVFDNSKYQDMINGFTVVDIKPGSDY